MKKIPFLPVVVIVASLMLSACGGISLSTLLPAAQAASVQAAAPAATRAAPAAMVAPASTVVLDAQGLQNTYENVYAQVNPSVVTIEISSQITNTGFGRSSSQVVPTAEGSGFVWDSEGHIVTNNHVVDNAAKITVTFADGSTYDAKLTGTDPNTDLAVVQVSGAPKDLLKPVAVGDSTQVKVGQLVAAIGNPYGQSNTMTTGIVSAISRSIQAGSANNTGPGGISVPTFSIPDVIQTDAAINPGNSGGVLVNMDGQVIGVPSQIESASGSNSGIGFAIPSAIVSQVVPQLISKGSASHSYLGISGTTMTASVAGALNIDPGQQGVLVVTLAEGGPAQKAGLQASPTDESGTPTSAGDIITAIDGQPIKEFEELVSYLYSNTQPGQKVTLTVQRGGKTVDVPVTLGEQPKQ